MAKNDNNDVGLILSGGGARAAYQVGVLMGIAELVPRKSRNPFSVICGTSAGAINAAALASHTNDYRAAVRGLERIWGNLTAEQVYRTDVLSILFTALRWMFSGVLGGATRIPTALLDVTPLQKLLSVVINFPRIQEAIDRGDLRALSITASSYATGTSMSFFQAATDVQEWQRARRIGRREKIAIKHLLASSAIPALFPAVHIDGGWYGDGAVRQLAPVSPALHLGADRILVVGVSGNFSSEVQVNKDGYPSIAQIVGHILNSAFVDTLEGDVERLERINHTLSAIPEDVRRQKGIRLREVDVLKIYPSQPIDQIASEHIHELPRTLRFFLRGSGATHSTGSTAVSYLLFEPGFCRRLMSLGYHDALAREQEIRAFLRMDTSPVSARR